MTGFIRKRWIPITIVVGIILLYIFTCRWSPFFGQAESQPESPSEFGSLQPLFPSCQPVKGNVLVEVTDVREDTYILTEYGDCFGLDSDWHYEMAQSLAPQRLLLHDVVLVKVSRGLPGHDEKVVGFVSAGYSHEDLLLKKLSTFNEGTCSNQKPASSESGEKASQPNSNSGAAPDPNNIQGCWSKANPCDYPFGIDFVGECANSTAVRRSIPWGTVYWWPNKNKAPGCVPE